jgi:hypothetical protein
MAIDGWIKIHRKLQEKAYYKKDSEAVHLWLHILMNAHHKPTEELLGGKPIICQPGQFTTGRKQLASATGICESKIERLLTKFEKIEQQIEQRKTNTNRLITVLCWSDYQISEQPTEQQVNNDRTTTEQRVNTLKEYKEIKEHSIEGEPRPAGFKIPTTEEIAEYCTERRNGIKASEFFNFYQSKGWMVGKNKMKDWKAAVRTWEESRKKDGQDRPAAAQKPLKKDPTEIRLT